MLRCQLVNDGQKTPLLCHDRIVAALIGILQDHSFPFNFENIFFINLISNFLKLQNIKLSKIFLLS
jgi:hypothetical protein